MQCVGAEVKLSDFLTSDLERLKCKLYGSSTCHRVHLERKRNIICFISVHLVYSLYSNRNE
jgi:hypothetical protein